MKHGYRSSCKTRRAQILALFSFVGVAGNLYTWTRPDLMINYMHTRRNTPSTFRSNSSNRSMYEIFIPNPNTSSSPRLVIWRMFSWWFKGSWKLCWWSFPWWLGDVQLWHGPPGSTWWSSSPCWLIRTHEFLFHLFLSFCSTYVYIYIILYIHYNISLFLLVSSYQFYFILPSCLSEALSPRRSQASVWLRRWRSEDMSLWWCLGDFRVGVGDDFSRGVSTFMGEPQASIVDGLPSGKLT